MNWKRPQDELPPENEEVLIWVQRKSWLKEFETRCGIAKHNGSWFLEKMRARFTGFFEACVIFDETWRKYYITSRGDYESDNNDVITHWCEIEEPK
jgi:hypothetical protein